MFKYQTILGLGLSSLMLGLASAMVAIPAGMTRAAELCEDMNILVREARSNFSNWQVETTATAMPPMLPGAEDCTMSQSLSGAKVYHCAWKFAYRAVGAYGTFDAYKQSFQECFGDRAHLSRDQSVNHPDFYDLHQYQLDQVNVTLSIKDKSALQSTYVFVRVHGVIPD